MNATPDVIRQPDADQISTEMYLRDGFPHAVVCKVTLNDGRIGIGIFRQVPGQQGELGELGPQAADKAALDDALENVQEVNYEGLQEHVQMMHDRAVARSGVDQRQHLAHCEYCEKTHDSRVACPEYVASRGGANDETYHLTGEEMAQAERGNDLQASLGQPAR